MPEDPERLDPERVDADEDEAVANRGAATGAKPGDRRDQARPPNSRRQLVYESTQGLRLRRTVTGFYQKTEQKKTELESKRRRIPPSRGFMNDPG
jgi:hypothetical protein